MYFQDSPLPLCYRDGLPATSSGLEETTIRTATHPHQKALLVEEEEEWKWHYGRDGAPVCGHGAAGAAHGAEHRLPPAATSRAGFSEGGKII